MLDKQDCIIIEGLKVETVIGCLDWERQILQPLLIDLKIYTDLSVAGKSDDLVNTLNYVDICQYVTEIICERKAQLIEHVAYLVMAKLMQRFPTIEQIDITVHKPEIIKQTKSIAVHMQRSREQIEMS